MTQLAIDFFFAADILPGQSTKAAGEINLVNNGSVPSTVPVSGDSESACTAPGPWNYSSPEWNVVDFNVTNYTCAFPAITNQNVCRERGHKSLR